MNSDDLRSFARRDWAAISRSKQQYWADRFHAEGGGPARIASDALFEHARRLGTILSAPERARDLAHHLYISDLFDRAARVLSNR